VQVSGVAQSMKCSLCNAVDSINDVCEKCLYEMNQDDQQEQLFVSKEMALDAGFPEMEGMPLNHR
jgi:hypothetical protein